MSRLASGARTYLAPVLMVAAVLLSWLLLATVLAGRHIVPQPWVVIQQIAQDFSTLILNTQTTVGIAAQGLLVSVIIVLPLAAISVLSPVVSPVIMRVAVVIHTIPFLAIAPILIVVLPGTVFRVSIAALLSYFPLLVSVLLGLRSADSRAIDLIEVTGGRSLTQLLKVRIPSALPSLFAGLQIAIPASLIGALVAEFFGAIQGLGAYLVQAQSSLSIARTWGTAIYIGVLATLAYAIVAVLARLCTSWAGKGQSVGVAVGGSVDSKLRPSQALASVTIAVLLLGGLWQSLLSVFQLNPYFTKGPTEVWQFIVSDGATTGDTTGGGFWEAFIPALGQTAVDSAVGFAVGMTSAVLAAVLMVAVRPLGTALMPLAIALRSTPLVALTPLIVLVFGRGLLAVTVLVSLVTFFPTLVNLLVALRSTPEPACDVVRAAGGSSVTVALKARMMYAVPALTASARIAVPAAVTGALLAEWLATAKGVGHILVTSAERSDYLTLWSSGVLVVVTVLILFGLVGVVDRSLSNRLGLSGN